jgi:hypothetical protein
MAVLHYYTRRGCHLCEIMLDELLPLIRGRIDIEIRDIDTVAEWRAKYDVQVPAIEFEGRLLGSYPLDYGAIRTFLAAMPENGE